MIATRCRVIPALLFILFVFVAPVHAADPPTAEDLAKELKQLQQQRFYRNASAVLDTVNRYALMDPSRITRADQFMRAFFEGRWDEIRATLESLPADLSGGIFNKMLEDLTGRTVPVVTLDDFVGLADACPGELTTDRIRKLGLLLRVAVPKEQEVWLKQALDKGTRRLGRSEPNKLITGRILLHADFDDLARQYLPTASEATQIEDEVVREELLNFLAAQEELEQFQQTRIAKLWEQKARVFGDPQADSNAQQQAADRLAELLGRAPIAAAEPWLRSLLRAHPAAMLRVAASLGRIAQTKIYDADITLRTNNLNAQKALLLCVSESEDLAKAPWNAMALALADWWMQEAENTFQNHPSYRSGSSNRPHVLPGELLDAAPAGPWLKALPDTYQERIDLCLSKAVLVSDRYEEATELIVQLAKRNATAAVTLAEEYLKAWAFRHNPQIPEAIRKQHQLPTDARIMVTPIMMERNIASLAQMMDVFRQHGVRPQNGPLLVDAFDVCYSHAEVYQRSHIEKVFGPIDDMDEEMFSHMIRRMTDGLSSRWRKMESQEASGTRRTEAETLAMVRAGYQAAIDMIEQRTQKPKEKHPDAWRELTLAGSLLSDWGDFEYYQELVAESNTKRMEGFREKNALAETYFTRAAGAYAERLPKLSAGQQSIDVYLPWFHSLLGIGTNGELNLAKPLDRRVLNKIHDLIRDLPGGSGKAHIDKFAKFVSARMEDTQKPLHEDLKYKYLAGSLVITKESPFSFQASNKVSYYDELLDEIRLETRVDGPNIIHRDREFGILLTAHHTEAMGRMADFGKYLVNENLSADRPPGSPVRKPTTVSPVTYGAKAIQGRRDQLELNIREALSLFFDVRSITFSPRDVQPRATERPGWQETVFAYIHARAKDSSVDKIPRIQMSLDFLDMTGPVTISAESAETMIEVTDQPQPSRPFQHVDLTQLVDVRNLASSEEVLLEINATANGLVPELEELIDVEALGKQLPIARIDPHEGTLIRQLTSWGAAVGAVSERHWTVALDASSLLDPPRRIGLRLPPAKVAGAAVKYRAYQDMDLVDLAEPTLVVGQGVGEVQTPQTAGLAPWLPYAAGAGGFVVLLAVGLGLALLLRGGRERPLRARDVFHMPEEIDGFVVVQLLRALGASDLVKLSESQRGKLQEEIQRLQTACFNSQNGTPSEDELRGVARKWLKMAC